MCFLFAENKSNMLISSLLAILTDFLKLQDFSEPSSGDSNKLLLVKVKIKT